MTTLTAILQFLILHKAQPFQLQRPHITKMSPLLSSKSQSSFTDTQTHTHSQELKQACATQYMPSCFNLQGVQTLVPIPHPCLGDRLPLVSHHASAGAGGEDDAQLGHSMAPRLHFLSHLCHSCLTLLHFMSIIAIIHGFVLFCTSLSFGPFSLFKDLLLSQVTF